MIELLAVMSAAWVYTQSQPHSRLDPTVDQLVLDLNAYGALSQRQIAAVVGLSAPSIAKILRRRGAPVYPGRVRGKLEPSGIDILLLLARTQLQGGKIDDDLLAFAAQRVADPGLIHILTGIPATRLRKARHHVIDYGNASVRNDHVVELRGGPATGA